MKTKLIISQAVALILFNFSFAQKFGYVDTEFVLSKLSEYHEAQKEVDKLSAGWEKEIDDLYVKVESMEAQYKAEEVLLTAELKKEKREAIEEQWKELKEFQRKVFGFEGLLFLKKQELVKPIQDKIFEAVEKVAKKQRLQIVFDKSGELVMIYTNPVHDYTEFVLEELGLAEKKEEEKK